MPVGDILFRRLDHATEADIVFLCECLGVAHSGDRAADAIALSRALRSATGHSIVNLTREAHGLAYRQVLLEVAGAMEAGAAKSDPTPASTGTDEELEDLIERRFVRQKAIHLRQFSDEELGSAAKAVFTRLTTAGFSEDTSERATEWFRARGAGREPDGSLRTAILVAGAESQLWLSAFGTAGKYWWLPKELGLVVDLVRAGGPALRKIVPATLRLIQIRKRPTAAPVAASEPTPRS